MNKKKTIQTIHAQGFDISFYTEDFKNEYLSLTDIAKYKSETPNDVIRNWMRTKDTIEFLGLWEKLHNAQFKPTEFDGFKKEAGYNSFTLSPQRWIEKTNAIGIVSKSGRYGGTFAHIDIAFEFASWISAEFKLYIIKDYQRLKNEENNTLSLNWNLNRTLSKINYRIHTDAIRDNIIPPNISKKQISVIYASEADVLNISLFGMTAKDWRDKNPDQKTNIRDNATIEQLLVLANLESLNAELINMKISQSERLIILNKTAVSQLKTLIENKSIKDL